MGQRTSDPSRAITRRGRERDAEDDRHLDIALRGRPRRKAGLHPLACSVCGGLFTSRRVDAESCGPKCRKRRQRQQEALSQINVAPTTGVAEIVSGDVTAIDTKRKTPTTESRRLDELERNKLCWQMTVANSHCHSPGCREPRAGLVLRRRPSGPMFCPHHFEEAQAV